MKLWNRRGLAALMAVVMLVALTVACSKGQPTSQENGSADKSTGQNNGQTETTNQDSTKPKYPDSMSYWVVMDAEQAAVLKSYSDMAMYKELEKITGTKVEFQHPPIGQEGDQFNLMMASGKLPDVIDGNWSDNPDKAIQEGKIVRLNEIIDKYAPNLSAVLKEYPEIKKLITTDEGNMYVFPNFVSDAKMSVYNGLIVRKDWLDKLKLPVPETIDDWEKMLIAFRDNDPNGNNKKDEIPFFLDAGIGISYAFVGAYGITMDFYKEGNVVKYGPYQPEFKQYLTLMNKWYKEGLIAQDYLTTDLDTRDSHMTNNTLGSMDGWVGGGIGKFIGLMKDKDPNFKLMGVPFPSLERGGKAVAKMSPQYGGYGAAISASAKNPEQIAAWLDYAYGKEGNLMFNYGIEGESYTVVNGKPTFTDLVKNNPDKLPMSQALSKFNRISGAAPYKVEAAALDQYAALPEQVEAKENWAKADHDKLMPPLSLSADEKSKYAAIMTDLQTYQDEMVNKFIMGIEPLDKFDEYVRTLKKLNIEEAIAIEQAAYDRYLKK